MTTPTLTKKQQKKALSTKKGAKETIKNVLSNPYANYYPVLNETDTVLLKTELTKQLCKLVNDNNKVPWRIMKDVDKNERKQFRLQYIQDKNKSVETFVPDNDLKLNLIFGINMATKALENNEVASILINGDANPQLIVKHVINLCVLKNIPVLVVPTLGETLKNTTGIKTATMAIKNTITEDSKLFILTNVIKELFKNYPIPENHAHFNDNMESDEGLDESMENLDLKPINIEKLADASKNLHLIRINKANRIFVPKISSDIEGNSMEVDSMEFVGLGGNNDANVELKIKSKYNNLKVKRIKNNKNRPKKQKNDLYN